MMIDLKPCPFCGGNPDMQIFERQKKITITCTKCHVTRTQKWKSFGMDWLEEGMRCAWNKRTTGEE
jgi:hypothetical protein